MPSIFKTMVLGALAATVSAAPVSSNITYVPVIGCQYFPMFQPDSTTGWFILTMQNVGNATIEGWGDVEETIGTAVGDVGRLGFPYRADLAKTAIRCNNIYNSPVGGLEAWTSTTSATYSFKQLTLTSSADFSPSGDAILGWGFGSEGTELGFYQQSVNGAVGSTIFIGQGGEVGWAVKWVDAGTVDGTGLEKGAWELRFLGAGEKEDDEFYTNVVVYTG